MLGIILKFSFAAHLLRASCKLGVAVNVLKDFYKKDSSIFKTMVDSVVKRISQSAKFSRWKVSLLALFKTISGKTNSIL